MVMTNSPLYEFEDDSAIFTLRQMIGMGHEIGLHFDFDSEEEREENPEMGSQVVSESPVCLRVTRNVDRAEGAVDFFSPAVGSVSTRLFSGGRQGERLL